MRCSYNFKIIRNGDFGVDLQIKFSHTHNKKRPSFNIILSLIEFITTRPPFLDRTWISFCSTIGSAFHRNGYRSLNNGKASLPFLVGSLRKTLILCASVVSIAVQDIQNDAAGVCPSAFHKRSLQHSKSRSVYIFKLVIARWIGEWILHACKGGGCELYIQKVIFQWVWTCSHTILLSCRDINSNYIRYRYLLDLPSNPSSGRSPLLNHFNPHHSHGDASHEKDTSLRDTLLKVLYVFAACSFFLACDNNWRVQKKRFLCLWATLKKMLFCRPDFTVLTTFLMKTSVSGPCLGFLRPIRWWVRIWSVGTRQCTTRLCPFFICSCNWSFVIALTNLTWSLDSTKLW